ncbi:hypothetical protein LCGC14_0567460 [marine sediment metagenome]|uniref:Radical SAM core domain-containing protein n=1 Tax=marine sediment metagenome TaxID=412755 RepID=A0A0F9UTE2_9ZZZZ
MNRTPRLSKSAIEYLDYVWNFESGCTKGCHFCYAAKIAKRFPGHYPNGFEPTLYPEAFTSPWHLRKPSIIGVGYMGDLFDDAIDPEGLVTWGDRVYEKAPLRQRIFWTIQQAPQHRFLFLTKQPQNLARWSPFPDNCWVGVSATDMRMLADACYELKRVEARVKYISLEPFLDYSRTTDLLAWNLRTALVEAGINWLVIGGRSGADRFYPPDEWIDEIESAADGAGIPVFEKNNLRKVWANPPKQDMP